MKCNKIHNRIKDAFDAGDRKGMRKQIQAFTRDPEVKSWALRKSGFICASEASYRAEAKLLDYRNPFKKTVEWELLPKKNNNGHRITCSLPYDLKATHYLIKDMISAQMPNVPFIHNIGGENTRDTLAVKIAEMLNLGFVRVQTYDIRDCFQNVNPQSLFDLPLPRKAIENALIIDNLTMAPKALASDHFTDYPHGDFIYNSIVDVSNTNGPTGLIQGSPASNSRGVWSFRCWFEKSFSCGGHR